MVVPMIIHRPLFRKFPDWNDEILLCIESIAFCHELEIEPYAPFTQPNDSKPTHIMLYVIEPLMDNHDVRCHSMYTNRSRR